MTKTQQGFFHKISFLKKNSFQSKRLIFCVFHDRTYKKEMASQ